MAGEKPHAFTAEGAHKLVDAERRLAALEINLRALQRIVSVHQAPYLPTIAFAQEDAAAGETKTFYFGKGLPGAEVEDTTRTVEVCNSTNEKIKDGMKCVIAWLMVEQSEGSAWHAIKVFGYSLIRGALKGALATGDSTKTIDGVSVLQGADPRTDPTSSTEEITVYNVHSWAADDNASAVAVWNSTLAHWELLQVTCPA